METILTRRLLILALVLVLAFVAQWGVAWGLAAWSPGLPRPPFTGYTRDPDSGCGLAVIAYGQPGRHYVDAAYAHLRHPHWIRQMTGGATAEEAIPRWADLPSLESVLAQGAYQHQWRLAAGVPFVSLTGGVQHRRGEVAIAVTAILLDPADYHGDRRALPLGILWPGAIANTAIYAAVFLALGFGFKSFKRWNRVRRGRCSKCGYQLADGVEACSECGHA